MASHTHTHTNTNQNHDSIKNKGVIIHPCPILFKMMQQLLQQKTDQELYIGKKLLGFVILIIPDY